MKKLLLVACLALAGCNTTGDSAQVAATIAQVQSTTRQICSFVPTARTVFSILSAFGVPGVSIAGDVATQICNAVTTAPLADGGPRQAKVNGVVIRGRFVR